MRARLALLCHVAVLAAALRGTQSSLGFLLHGPGLCLLLDRYALHLLPWASPVRWRREVVARVAWFLAGTAGFYLARRGIVPWWEAAHRGAVVSGITFVLELLAASMPVRWRGLGLGGAVALLVLLVPVIAALHPLHTVPKRTPAALGLAFEDIRFRTADGVLLAGWVVPHSRARGNIVFCHGHGRNRGHVAGLLPTLHGLGLNVLAFDFRGHGDSAGHTSTFGHREVGDLLAAVAYLERRFPGKPVFLAGISLGAAVSLQALPRLGHAEGVWSEGTFSDLASVVDNEFRWLPGWVRKPLVWSYHQLGWLDCGFRVRAVSPLRSLRGLSVPVYFCHGCNDELIPLAEGKALHGEYTGPKWRWWVEGASHYNVRQRNHEEYLRRLRGFLEGRLEALARDPTEGRRAR
jgi:fermentation-respiration switch protein FrsA (DUF1100 family)